MSNQKRKYVSEDQPQSPRDRKKQKLITHSTSLLAIPADNLFIVSTENRDDAYVGDITFNIMDIVHTKLASFTAKWDSQYKRIKFGSRFFKTYSHSIDSTLNGFVQIAFSKVLNYIFDYKNKSFSTVVFPSDFMQRHQIKLRDNYRPYIVGNKYYFLRNREANPLFNKYNVESYECTLLIRENSNRNDKFISNLNNCKPALKNAMKSEQRLWNGIDGILGIIMEYIPDGLEFQRQCIITKTRCLGPDNGKVTIYFDFPITFVAHSSYCDDIPFKLRINGTSITDQGFFFSNDHRDDVFRLNTYADSNNTDQFYIDRYHDVLVWENLQTRWGSLDQCYYGFYGYLSFEYNIETSRSGLEIVNIEDDNVDNSDDDR